MNRLVGVVFLAVGLVLLFYGWRAHEAVAPHMLTATAGEAASQSIWMLGLGSVAAVWGLFALLRRTAL